MFGSSAVEPVAKAQEVANATTSDLIPLSHFELDHPRPAEGWPNYLGKRAIAFRPDDLGRDCICRQDARRLLDEQRANELRKAKLRQLAEQEAVEADRQWRASLPRGLPWYEIPDGVPAVVAMTAADKAAQPKRLSPLQEALSGSSMTFHPLPSSEDES